LSKYIKTSPTKKAADVIKKGKQMLL